MTRPLAAVLALLVSGCGATGARPDVTPIAGAARAETLAKLYDEYWEEHLQLNPIQATFQGDPRYNHLLPDFFSEEHRRKVHDFNERWLERAKAIGGDGLSGQDLLSYRVFVYEREMELEGERHPRWLLPINQFMSPPVMAVRFGSGTGPQPFKTVADYDAWLQRAARLPVLFDTAIANMREGVQRGVVQPRPVVVKVLPQLDALIKDRPEETAFWGPITRMPETFPAAERDRLTSAYRKLIADELMPAYRELRAFLAEEYLPKTRATVSIEALPGGPAWYAYLVRLQTSTQRTPAEIHALGLAEVERIHGEMRNVMTKLGFTGDLAAFLRYMRDDARFAFPTEEALLAYYRGLEQRVNARIPELFSLVPKAPFEIRPVEPYRAASHAGGSYISPSEDGTRPGIFYVNTHNLPSRRTWDAEALYLHEAIPGHHFQIALQQEQTGLPRFRRFGGETVFSEGWGLYAESLGHELGVYGDPHAHFGALQAELWRAMRLVVDTGLHHKGWTREQAIRYMVEGSAEGEAHATAEAERYIVWPGQALAYKIGELEIKRLRAHAEKELGPRFDIRAFHAEVLKDGALPLLLLEEKIERWIASQKGA
jgi:uncharacterized protein (DUF885 family)